MKIQFKWYVHEESDEEAGEFAADICEQQLNNNMSVQLDVAEFLGLNPFYEVEFDVELDTETGKFDIVGARSTQGGWCGDWELTKK